MQDMDNEAQASTKQRKEPARRNFDTAGTLNACLATLGAEFWDESTRGFGLRVSPKGKQVWIWRFRGPDGKEVPMPDGPLPYYPMPPKGTPRDKWPVPKGKYTLQGAREQFEEAKRRAFLTQAERDAEDGEKMTLAQAVPIYLEKKRKVKDKSNLGSETKDAYLSIWKWLEPLAGNFVLKDTIPGKWKNVFEGEALRACVKRELLENIDQAGKDDKPLRNAAQQKAIRKRLERGLADNWEVEPWWLCLSEKEQREVNAYLNSVTGNEKRFKEKLESSQVMQAAALVQGVYTYLWNEGTLDIANPIKRVKHSWRVVAPEGRKVRIPTLNMPLFWTALQNRRYKPSKQAITIMTLAGWRNSAARMMRWEQLDFEKGVYHVRPGDIGWKGFKGDMPLSDFILEMLRERYKIRTDMEWVFPRRHGTRFPYLSRVGDSIAKCCEEMSTGVHYRPHDLRRGFSTAAKLVCNDLVLVGALMGHKWAVDKHGKAMTEESTTVNYTVEELRVLHYVANRTTELLLQICGAKPMQQWVKDLLASRGYHADEFVADNELPEDDEVVTESD
ncbi:tyrosine-type recombinase/integrase [Burkholderia pseudomallei]|uniref:tyrosine-type recombinase/integrase n=1 Tax=Burkholderia pseudomallei TaxID=28450 RepID=UPI0009AD5A83|nr:tyrosine-type recombinase/integrase [Burkholderia pseudomallei]